MSERIISWLLTTGGFGLTILLIKKWLGRVEAKLDTMEENYHACREELPRLYAPRKGTEKELSRLWDRTDNHASEIEYAKGLRNGTGK